MRANRLMRAPAVRRPVRLIIMVLAIVLPMAMASCSSSGTKATGAPTAGVDNRPIKAGGTVTIALAEDPDALDPTTANTFVGRIVFTSICEKLYDIDANLNIVPQLAAALPDVSPDGKTVTIKLRTGVTFNDGTPMDAAAVKTSLDRDLTMKGSSRKAELKAVAAVSVVDPSTIQLTLKRPFAPLIAQLADRAGMVMSPKALASEGANFGADPVCVGPFEFTSRTSGDQIVVTKSPYYYDKSKVKLDKIIYKIITDPNIRAANLRSGDVQLAERLDTSDVPSLRADSKLRVVAGGEIGYQGITININNATGSTNAPGTVNTPLAQHADLRQAFELSLDRNTINKVVFNGLYAPDCTPLPPHSQYRDPSITCPGYDLAKAKQLVAASGVKTPIPVTLLTTANATSERLAQVVQGMAQQAGFAVKVQPEEFVTSLDQAMSGKYDAIMVGWSGRVDPDGDVTGLITPGVNDYSGLHDPIIDNAVQQASATGDAGQRRTLYATAINEELKQLGVIYLYHPVDYLGMASNIAGVSYFGDGLPRLAFAGYAA